MNFNILKSTIGSLTKEGVSHINNIIKAKLINQFGLDNVINMRDTFFC